MPTLTQQGRVAIAESLALRPIHVAWGVGDGSWSSPPAENAGATALISELGRRIATVVGYVTPNPSGSIVLPTGTFEISGTPTNHLFVRAVFDFAEEPSAVIREVGVFVGTQTNPALPLGTEYFEPGDITAPGRLIHIENLVPIFRAPAIRETFEMVVTF